MSGAGMLEIGAGMDGEGVRPAEPGSKRKPEVIT